jgi:hypothetical protein
MLQIASQSLKQCQNRGGRMPRNPWSDQIGMGGQMLSVKGGRITPEYAPWHSNERPHK